ncbi:YdcF family protein [Ruminococcus sp.]|uniref:YdcF family protein n=1 Tax=Ruminococcus sp. TaxID=41978 RepID=UPI0025D3A6A0|nr:YdcF family protein [Ruminococcus sp.]MBQ9540749.1 YdcF family protein [Ruminococcus sp.]
MLISELLSYDPTDENIHRLLYDGLDYDGSAADLIMVLGSRKACEYRVPEAVRLYKSGRAPMMLFSGGKVQKTALGEIAEWLSMETAAISLGVSERDILLEKCSMNTAENFSCSENLLRKVLPDGGRIILVTTAYHMRRALLTAEKILPQYEFISCPVQKGSATKENWYKTDKGRRTVLDEWGKLRYYIRAGIL